MDWASDHFVRLYTRETDDDLLLSWEARAVWHELLKKFDKQGKLTTKRGLRGLAALVRVPLDVVDRAIPELIEDGRLKNEGALFYAPNYQLANYTPRAPAARMTTSRIRSGLHGAGGSSGGSGNQNGDAGGSGTADGSNGSHGASVSTSNNLEHAEVNENGEIAEYHVTPSDAPLRDVTDSAHIRIRADQGRSVHSARSRGRAASRSAIPADWQPRQRERDLAQTLGLDPDAEAREFLAYWQGDGRAKADWDQTFASRLEAEGKRCARRSGPRGDSEARDLPELE
jgi:hypothetical protein